MTTPVVCLLVFAAAPADEAFETRVRPVLVEHCQGCHGPKKQMGGLRLDSREALLKGGDSGPALERLVPAIRHEGDLKMPPRKRLPQPAIDALTAWVKAGAPWPAARDVAAGGEAWRTHWAFQAVRRPPVPSAGAASNPIDRFLAARLVGKGLTLSPEADRRTLIRRLSYDLVGLPPHPDDVDAFVSDPRPDAYERLVDRLLASPRHGERWGRYWLDVARYADTKGYVFFEEADYPWGWTYRDYVVEALNADLPYDRFLLEQLAADRLDLGGDGRPLRALGFLALGGRFMNNVHDILDDRIDVVTRGLMGLTVGCARCHDHKFDPVPMADYYALYGVFASAVEPTVPPLYDPAPATREYAAFRKELAKREKALATFVEGKFAELRRGARTRAGEYLLAAHARRGQPRGDDFMLLADGGDLNPTMLLRWQSYLERTAKAPHRVWGAWHAFAALPEGEFAAQAKPLAARLATDPAVNPLVRSLFVCPPLSLADVAIRYGKLFAEINESRVDPDYEEVRQVLDGPNVAANIQPAEISNLELLPDRPAQATLQKHQRAVEQWRATGKGAPPRANVLLDLPRPVEPVVFRRGNPNNPGERVARRLPALLSGRPLGDGSGRLELARAVADPKNPLTARVLVNRVWMHHFGQGLVATAGDFGLRADPPTHPDLLDWLADEFVRSGWSVKHLHRLIVTSAAYRQSSADRPASRSADPDNALLWHYPRRHLDFEALRDTLLVMAGQLDSTVGGPSAKDALSPNAHRRTLYSWVDRLHVPGLFRAFDFPSPDASSPKRDRTMVPQQALFLMNGPFALHAARALAARPEVVELKTPVERVMRMYRICYGRLPDADELALAREFLDPSKAGPEPGPRFAQALLLSNEFVFVE
ncbi:MAG: PSD1 and planctomycete cytochrome C domain-containing protein [Gemmataceae bacterium]